jgi:outer membrane protein assembly factor BamB
VTYIKKTLIIAVVLIAAISLNIQAETVSGTVFLDSNSNGNKDTGEAGVAQVMVSDGDAVTKTSSSGTYSFTFSVLETRFVSITTPTGYRLTTPFYIKIEPGGSTYTMNFGLTPDPTPSNVAGADFKFIAGADIQHSNTAELYYDWQTMEDLTGSVDIGFATWAGDLTPDGVLAHLQQLREVENTLSYPTYNSFGGHDGNTCRSMEYWETAMGPFHHSWDYAGRHFMAIVSELGYLTTSQAQRQERWVFNDLAQINPGTDVYLSIQTPEGIQSMLNAIAASYDLKGIIRGSLHATYSYLSGLDNVPMLNSAPIRKDDYGVFTKLPRIVSISGSTISSQIFPLGQEKRLIVVSPTPNEFVSRNPSILIQVNAYNSSSKVTSVKYTLSGPAGVVASNVPLTKSTWWSWRETWDASSAPEGDYTLEVMAYDDQSQTWQKTINFPLTNEQPPALALGQNWPSFFGPDNQNRKTTDNPTGRLRLVWAVPVGSTEKGGVMYSAPLVVDGKVFVGVWDPDIFSPEGGIAAFDALTGQSLWKLKIGDVHHTPAVDNGLLYTVTSQGIVHCINLVTHSIVWTYDIYPSVNYGYKHAIAPVMVSNGKVYVVGDYTNALCLNATNGSLIWSQDVDASSHVLSAVYVSGGVAYFVSQDNVYARDANTGVQLFKEPLPHRQRKNGTSLVYDNVLYASYQNNIAAYNAGSGSEIWRVQSGGNYKWAMPVYSNGKIFYSDGAELVAKDASNGNDVWRFSTADAELMADNKYQAMLEPSSHALTDNCSYVGSDNGAFYVFAADSGEVVSRYVFGPPVKSSATISGNMVFIGSTDGNLYAFGPGLVPKPKIKNITAAAVVEWEGIAGMMYEIFWREDASDTWKLADTVTGTGTNRWIDAGDAGRPAPNLENPVIREYKIELVL